MGDPLQRAWQPLHWPFRRRRLIATVARCLAITETWQAHILDEQLASPKAAAALTNFSGVLGGVVMVDGKRGQELTRRPNGILLEDDALLVQL